ncbi:MAG: hypothetical protein ACI89E_001418, partial [Planctomycetota bacterium]
SLSVPEMYAVIPVADGEKFMTTLDGALDFLVRLNPELSVTRRPYKGVDYSSLNVGIPIGVLPTFAVIGEQLWISNSAVLIKREIRRVDKGEDYPRGAHPLFGGLTGDDGEFPDDLRGASYFDAGRALSALYSGGLSLSGMISMAADLPDGLMEVLPPGDIFSRHTVPSFTETRLIDGALITKKVGSFGPEPLLLGIGGILGGFLAATRIGEVEFVPAPFFPGSQDRFHPEPFENAPGDGRLGTQLSFATIEVGLLLYSMDHGQYPRDLLALLAPSKAYPDGYLGEPTVPLDGWGNGLVYRLFKDGNYTLYSIGPNGRDDDNSGDDFRP